MNEKNEHLKALGFELGMDLIVLIVLLIAYKFTSDTFLGKDADDNMNFLRNAFVFIAPGSVESFRIMVSVSRENKKWDTWEVILSSLSILITVALALQCLLGYDNFSTLYVGLIAIYPIRIVMNVGFEFFTLIAARRC